MGLSAKFDADSDGAALDEAADDASRLRAARVLRARRLRKSPEPSRLRLWALICTGFVAVAFVGAAMLRGGGGRERPQPMLVQEASALATAPAATAPSAVAAIAEGLRVERPSGAIIADPPDTARFVRARVLTSSEVQAASGGAWEHGVRVMNAVAGNNLSVGSGDIIVELCDQPGVQTAAEIMAALEEASTTCVVTLSSAPQPQRPSFVP